VIRILALAGLLASLAGCSSQDWNVLAQDKNALCVNQTSVYETVKVDRNWGCEYPPPGFQLVPITGK
jgi:hypothetical protein